MPEKKKEAQKIKAVPKSKPEIGIDTTNSFPDNLLDAAASQLLDTGVLENFSTVSQTREQIYSLIDTMAQDSTLAAVVESYAEDATETADSGKIMWAESSDDKVSSYVNWLLEDLNIDKHIYLWTYSLVKYGDVYLRLYRQSDYGEDLLFGSTSSKKSGTLNEDYLSDKVDDNFGKLTEEEISKLEGENKESLKEAVYLNLHSKNDPYVHYVEMVPNPGEMFELTKLGKTMGYIDAPVTIQNKRDVDTLLNRYKLNKKDVTVYSAGDFVHGCLEDNSSRTPEEVTIFLDNDLDDTTKTEANAAKATYKVKRGQSLLYNQFKNWRELTLLENSVLLNRLTKSSISRLMQVEVGDMPKAKVRTHIAQLKNLFAQKAALDKDKSYQEYTNPGPMENLVIIPVHEGKGKIENTTIGGDVDPKQLTDLSWFQDKLFGGLRVPKQFFGVTDDNAGFSGGESLAIISSKYGKAVKRVQNTICQMITDLIHLFLIDKGMYSFINKFVIKVQPPVTKDEQERRQNNDNRIRYVGDIMQQFSDVDDPLFKLKLDKLLLAPVVNDSEVLTLLQDKIDELEKELHPEESEEESSEETVESEELEREEPQRNIPSRPTLESEPTEEVSSEVEAGVEEIVEPVEETGDSYMPSPEELGQDMTQNQ